MIVPASFAELVWKLSLIGWKEIGVLDLFAPRALHKSPGGLRLVEALHRVTYRSNFPVRKP